jgi:hypothetical protein
MVISHLSHALSLECRILKKTEIRSMLEKEHRENTYARNRLARNCHFADFCLDRKLRHVPCSRFVDSLASDFRIDITGDPFVRWQARQA